MENIEPEEPTLDPLEIMRRKLRGALIVSDSQRPDQMRAVLQVTLGEIQSFLADVFGPHEKSLTLLRELIYALQDLDRGNVVPLLKPRKVSHRSPDPIAEEGFRAFAAATMELLVKGGERRKNAAKRVADNLHRQGYRGKKGRIYARSGWVVDNQDT